MTAASRTLPFIVASTLAACGQPEGPAVERPSDAGRSVHVDVGFNVCPKYEFLMVFPSEIGPGVLAAVAASAKDPEGGRVKYRWRASSGSFSNRSRSVTSYECEEPGAQTLTVTATDLEDCASAGDLAVVCLEE